MTTLRDVAKAVGLSESTVSRALQRPESVATQTLSEIRAKVLELDYKPRGKAAPRRRTKRATIAVLVPDISNPYFAAIVKAVQERAAAQSYRVVIGDSNEDKRRELDFIAEIEDDVNGIILVSPRSNEADIERMQSLVPIVMALQNHSSLPTVMLDDTHHIDRIMTHLKALGHRKIAFIAGPATSTTTTRRTVAIEAHQSRDKSVEFTMLGNVSPFPAGGFSVADEVIGSGVTAVIAFNDMVAMGLISRLVERGVRVPEDLSVVGFDDVIIAGAMQPPLSTIRLPLTEVGHKAVDLLHEWIETKQAPASVPDLHGELIVRRSTGVVSEPQDTGGIPQ